MFNIYETSELERLSYFAGMLDHKAKFTCNYQNKRVIIYVRTESKNQILAFQKYFGGNIRIRFGKQYEIKYKSQKSFEIIKTFGIFLPVQRAMIEKICACKQWSLPICQPPSMSHYIGGAIDARVSFHIGKHKERIYPMFIFPIQNNLEHQYFQFRKITQYNSIKYTHQSAIDLLAQLSPYILEYEKYNKIFSTLIQEPFDPSIANISDPTYHVKFSQKQHEEAVQRKNLYRQKRIQQKQQKIEERARQHEAAKAERTRIRQEQWDQRKKEREIEAALKYEAEHEKVLALLHSPYKTCRICGRSLPKENFHVQRCNEGGLKHECKKCSHDRYVLPYLPKLAARARAWQKAHPEKTKESRRKKARLPQCRLRTSLCNRLKNLIEKKTERYHELIGCTPKELVVYLEQKFKDGMSWDNYGKWHIDHIIPCRAFDLTIKEQRLKCFNHTNLQPLWGEENLAKSDKMPNGENARNISKEILTTLNLC